LAVFPLVGEEQNPDELLGITRDVASNFTVGLYAFNRDLAYCASCQKVFYGKLEKCPGCGSVNMLQSFSRV
jgi:anaerobic ribonucleoside-triphosphate reductase